MQYYPSVLSQPKDLRIELKNGQFVDIRNNDYYGPGTSLILHQGRIEAIVPFNVDSTEYNPDVVIDLKGKAVIPGLFNTHCHIQMTLPTTLASPGDMLLNKKYCEEQIDKNMKDCLLHGVTHIRDAWTDSLKRNKRLKARIESGQILGPRIHQCVLVGPENGNFTTKRSPLVRTVFKMRNMPTVDFTDSDSGVVTFPPHAGIKEIREAVDRAIDERGANYIKLYEQKQDWFTGNYNANFMTQEQLNLLVDYAHSRGIKTTIHQVGVQSFRKALTAGVWSLAHLPNNDFLTERDLYAFMDANITLEPTVSVLYYLCWRIRGDELENHENTIALTKYRNQSFRTVSKDFWIEPLHKCFIKGFEKHNRGLFKMGGFLDVSPLFRVYARSIYFAVENLKRLHGAGAQFATGNDAGAVCATEGMIHHELEMLKQVLSMGQYKQDLSVTQALRMATLNSAIALGLEDDFGSIDAGKVADLVILSGDPLNDTDIIGKKADAVFMNGRLILDNIGLNTIQ